MICQGDRLNDIFRGPFFLKKKNFFFSNLGGVGLFDFLILMYKDWISMLFGFFPSFNFLTNMIIGCLFFLVDQLNLNHLHSLNVIKPWGLYSYP